MAHIKEYVVEIGIIPALGAGIWAIRVPFIVSSGPEILMDAVVGLIHSWIDKLIVCVQFVYD